MDDDRGFSATDAENEAARRRGRSACSRKETQRQNRASEPKQDGQNEQEEQKNQDEHDGQDEQDGHDGQDVPFLCHATATAAGGAPVYAEGSVPFKRAFR